MGNPVTKHGNAGISRAEKAAIAGIAERPVIKHGSVGASQVEKEVSQIKQAQRAETQKGEKP